MCVSPGYLVLTFCTFSRFMILASFVMILVQYNFWTMRRFLLPLRLLVLDWKSELLAMIVMRRYLLQSLWIPLPFSLHINLHTLLLIAKLDMDVQFQMGSGHMFWLFEDKNCTCNYMGFCYCSEHLFCITRGKDWNVRHDRQFS